MIYFITANGWREILEIRPRGNVRFSESYEKKGAGIHRYLCVVVSQKKLDFNHLTLSIFFV